MGYMAWVSNHYRTPIDQILGVFTTVWTLGHADRRLFYTG